MAGAQSIMNSSTRMARTCTRTHLILLLPCALLKRKISCPEVTLHMLTCTVHRTPYVHVPIKATVICGSGVQLAYLGAHKHVPSLPFEQSCRAVCSTACTGFTAHARLSARMQ